MTSGGPSTLYCLRVLLFVSFYFYIVGGTPPWECRVCEDAMNTFHDHYKCAGDFLWNSEMKACEGPIMDCALVKKELQQPGKDMVQSFITIPDNAKKIWETMMMQGNVYQTCVALAKCDKDPPAPKGSKGKGTPCHEAFRSSECDGKLTCAAFDTSCTPQCYLCQIIIRDWPLFQETCKPAGAVLPNAVDVDEDADAASQPFGGTKTGTGAADAGGGANAAKPGTQKTFFLQLHDSVGTGTNSPSSSSSSPAHNALQPAGGSDDRTPVVTGYTLTQECFRQYNAIVLSKKTRYFAQWKKNVWILPDKKDRLFMNYWDANVACKCIGLCPLGRFEDLSLMDVCRYTAFEELFAEHLYNTPQHM